MGDASYCASPIHNENNMKRRISLLVALLFLVGTGMAFAQETLYNAYWNSKGYVVGAKLSQSGLHRWEGDTTWTHLGWNTPRISGITIDPNDSNRIFLAGGNGVIRSLDAGKTWKVVTSWDVTEVQDVDMHALNPNQVWCASAYGIWGTTDAGETWTEMNTGFAPGMTYTQTVEADRTTHDRVFAGTWGGLYVSTNGGRNWTLAAAEGKPVLDIQQSTANPNRWIMGTEKGGIWISNDNGATWTQARGASSTQTMYAAAIDPHNPDNMAAAGWDTGVWYTTNGGRSWTNLTRGLPNRNVYEVIYDVNVPGRFWVATIEGGLFHTTDMGRIWTQAGLGTSTIFDMQFTGRK
jgi:photosystem II stability/assembly factor-like uncharacterized protein